MFNDKVIVCKDCGQNFTFTASEQEFFAEKGFSNDPQHCKNCRDLRKQNTYARQARTMHDAVCANCGSPCQVPFELRSDRPVYCSDCFRR